MSIFDWAIAFILPLIMSAWTAFNAESQSYFGQWCLYMFLDATYSHLFHSILLIPARWIASRLPGAKVPPLDDEKKLLEQEEQSNDPSLTWPSPAIIAKLPEKWVAQGSDEVGTELSGASDADLSGSREDDKSSKTTSSPKKKNRSLQRKSKNKESPTISSQHHNLRSNHSHESNRNTQPYYLNHVRGSTRIRQASQRVAAATGTLVSSYILCSYSTLVTLDDIGLRIPSAKGVLSDFACGFFIGSFIVMFTFMLELRLGWIKVIGYRESVVPSEVFAINIAWDVLFHLGVSLNEEVMLRGWMFILGCHGLTTFEWFDDPLTAANFGVAASVILQSTLFALLHISSPGSTAISLLNLFLGGIAASLNVMVAGGSLWVGIGWHFGWNIFMGHILGRSTSGIPMSCAVVNVIPRPASSAKVSYEKYHGGTFGPEQGVLAPLAYTMGMVMVIAVYGWEQLGTW
eukprot:CAMPEP_0172546576 /NCGR_PEP_ID=MMETSP1067-20121228/16311_1 /TAXON_ID=265564 ORGANISM="Thalassiosira punctigera, Strain Tpunct2005C2" /NCGR_SAMPLE_ID=MMETSP1067 /ASSEMBLY_ACC=CAM_ASM_000444 /LENGTH=459 /DNA_ID=CAMNT_0013333535 /DNA_START=123 /DNA_END=1499 /DNA_ORIENTATION=-